MTTPPHAHRPAAAHPPAGAVRLVAVRPPEPARVTAWGVAVLLGLDISEVCAELSLGPEDFVTMRDLPTRWQQLGRRRAREAMAATGESNALAGLWFWTDKDQRGELWQPSGFPAEDGIWLVLPKGVRGA